MTTYSITTHGLTRLQTFIFHLDAPGPNASRQDAPHPHGVYIDPTGRFVLVPDLGADLVRVFAITQTGHLSPVQPLVTDPGLGPRHLAFWMPRGSVSAQSHGDDLYMYLVSELQNVVVGFKLGYTASGMSFSKVYQESVFGHGKAGPEGSKAAEIVISVFSLPVLCVVMYICANKKALKHPYDHQQPFRPLLWYWQRLLRDLHRIERRECFYQAIFSGSETCVWVESAAV